MAQAYLPPETEDLVTENRKPTRNFWFFWNAMKQAVPSGGAAPANAEYLVGALDPALTAERLVTNTATVTWDLSTPGQAKANTAGAAPSDAEYIVAVASAGLSAERVATDTATIDVDNGTAAQTKWSVIDNSISNAKLRQGVAHSVIGRAANSTGNVADIASVNNNDVLVQRSSALTFTALQSVGYWSPLTDPITPAIVFDSFGDTIAVWAAL